MDSEQEYDDAEVMVLAAMMDGRPPVLDGIDHRHFWSPVRQTIHHALNGMEPPVSFVELHARLYSVLTDQQERWDTYQQLVEINQLRGMGVEFLAIPGVFRLLERQRLLDAEGALKAAQHHIENGNGPADRVIGNAIEQLQKLQGFEGF